MELYGLVVNVPGMEPKIKLIEEDVYNWVKSDYNPKARIEILPVSVYEKILNESKHLDKVKDNVNEMYIVGNYKDLKCEVAPCLKEGFEDLLELREFVERNGDVLKDVYIRYCKV